MVTGKQKEFCLRVYKAARLMYEADKEHTVSPLFTTAQAMLESGWGDRAIGNNIFGVTAGASWTGRKVLVTTTEYFSTPAKTFAAPEGVLSIKKLGEEKYRYTVRRYFRNYDTLAGALKDHDALFRKPMYADAWPYRMQAAEFARRISDAHGARYATAPDYAVLMGKMIDSVKNIVSGL